MGRKFRALISIVLMLVLILPPASVSATSTVFFTAINDSLLPLSSTSMPAWVGGVLYAPISSFTSQSSGVSLGLLYSQNTTEQTATLYTLQNMLIFDLESGTITDNQTKRPLNALTVYRNGRVYLPVAEVCRFFGLTYSYYATDHGLLLRMRNQNAVLTDPIFLDAANTLLQSWANEYQQSQNPTPSTPTTQPDTPPDDTSQTTLLLGITGLTDTTLASTLDALRGTNITAILFFHPDQLQSNPDGVRRAVVEGHFIGIAPSSSDPLAQITAGNALLQQLALTNTVFVQSNANGLSSMGYLSFPANPTAWDSYPSQQSAALPLLLDVSLVDQPNQQLTTYLNWLHNHDFVFGIPTETALTERNNS